MLGWSCLDTRGDVDESWGLWLAPLGEGRLYIGVAGLARGAEHCSSHLPGWEWVEVRDELPEKSQRGAGPRKGERERENLVKIHYEHQDVAKPEASANSGSCFNSFFSFMSPMED